MFKNMFNSKKKISISPQDIIHKNKDAIELLP